jgi:DNA-binding MarR family transcriptional regulator
MVNAVAEEQRDFGIVLGLAYTRFVNELHAHLASEGFSDLGRSYGYVFRTLYDGPVTVTAIARGLGITIQGASKLIQEMVERGYVLREADPSDARAKQLTLGPRGESALRAARRFHRTFERRLAREIGAERAALLRELLTTLAGAETTTAPRL